MKQIITNSTLLLLLLISSSTDVTAQETPISLAGQWRFELDRSDAGIQEQWFARELPSTVTLPGVLTAQGIGDPISPATKWIGAVVDRSWFTAPEFAKYREPGNVKIPFWLQPELYYAGAAWFQREVKIPKSWANQRIVLFLERPHWETQVWVDNRSFGTQNALGTPHEYDLGPLTTGEHVLTIRVDNRMIVDVGENSHSVSDHTQGNWNGIVGNIQLQATPVTYIADLQVYPQVGAKSALVKGRLGKTGLHTPDTTLQLAAKSLSHSGQTQPLSVTADADGTFEATLFLGDNAQLWDEFQPALYEVSATLTTDRGEKDIVRAPFGLREIATEGTQFTVNGRKTFFRGTLECAIFPRTGHPPVEVKEWERVIRVCQAHGLNMIRFHSWCPPQEAFIAADALGFYLQVECSSWANSSTTLGDGKPVDAWLYAEADRILKAYGNHPSFVALLYGNEPGGRRHKEYLAQWVQHYRAQDARRLYSSAAGWPQLAENEFHVVPDPRVQAWGQGLKSRINANPPETITDYRDYIRQRNVPVISHEIGQWCVYPNFKEMKKYTGYLKPRNFEIFRDRLEQNGMADLAMPFLRASGKLQALCYKEDIESALRTPGMGGFQLLDLHDFPGQGTALVGVLDPFWEEKGYITAAEYRRFCNSTVPLARLSKRVFTTDETLTAAIEVAHFGPRPLSPAVVEWALTENKGRVWAQGEFSIANISVNNGIRLGDIQVDLRTLPAPLACKLVVRLRGTDFENDWGLWVYPPQPKPEDSPDVIVTSRFDEAARATLDAGGTVLLTIPGKQVRNYDIAPVKLGFSSIFWNTAWTGQQAPTTLGVLCDPKHPALADFPTEDHSDWQWWYLIHRAGALRLDLLPERTQPLVRIIDDWVTARPLGLMVEGRVNSGKILITGFDLTRDSDDPVSRQMRASLLHYLSSKKFKPKATFTPEQVGRLFRDQDPGDLTGVVALQTNSAQAGFEGENVVDGDPQTIWHTAWGDSAPTFPHDLIVEFETPRRIAGLRLLPRQDGNHNGWIKGYAAYASSDGKNWGAVQAEGTFAADAGWKTIQFATPTEARFLRLRALSGHADGPWASLAEFNLWSGE